MGSCQRSHDVNNLIYLATEALSDSVELIGTIQINLSIYLGLNVLVAEIVCYTHTHTRLTALFFRDYPGEPVPER